MSAIHSRHILHNAQRFVACVAPMVARYCLALMALCMLFAPSYAARRNQLSAVQTPQASYQNLESSIVAEMRELLALEDEISALRTKAQEKSRELNNSKNSANPLERIFVPRKSEELHQLLSEIEAKEGDASRRQAKIDGLAADADAAITRENLPEATRERLDVVSRRKVARIRKSIDEMEARLAKADTDQERERISNELKDARSTLDAAQQEFQRAYSR